MTIYSNQHTERANNSLLISKLIWLIAMDIDLTIELKIGENQSEITFIICVLKGVSRLDFLP